ncbi:hypothetical protein CkaCkLH20_03570 [Colletotrichum karsti]|uniref:Chitin-binding type-1 domain-containing protein n=1 Tax=Colletotrichum karsti TaxID=1095194 RepID=A0A9P6LMP9_9PEZI|nr:uncharacterized protein CkaCkLH20_03570 [Colletotrichum karsti]KAF9878670.1 hypothetical protein CkaCkLH20_03570 [Colletotrichum karsti]
MPSSHKPSYRYLRSGPNTTVKESNQGRKSALLIGINEYTCQGLADLRGCLSDVATTEKFLTEVAGISNINKLTSPRDPSNDLLPTLDNIVSEFETLARGAQPGDFIYIHYSGHGSRLNTAFRDLKGEHVALDECLVLARSDGMVECLRDVEVAFLLKQIADKGATVTFVLDCCHSGGATRSDDGVRGSNEIPNQFFADSIRKRIQSAKDLGDAWSLPRNVGNDGGRSASVVQHWMTASKGINFFAACDPLQKAKEVPVEATVRKGLFTECLASVLNAQNGGADQLSCDAVSNLVAHTLETRQRNDTREKQDAVFGGQGDCLFFGVESVVQPAVVVTSVETLRDVFAIYPIGRTLASLADYTAPLATCMVTSVESVTCEAHTQPSPANLEQVQRDCVAVSLRSILEDHVLRRKGLWVSAEDDSTEPVVQKVRDYISRESKLVQLKDAGEAFFRVLVRKDDNFTISFVPNQSEAEVGITGKPEDVLSHLEHLTIFYNLFDLAKNNATQQGLTVSKIGYLDKGVRPPNPHGSGLNEPYYPPTDLKPVPLDSVDILAGQSLGIEVRNKSMDSVYVEFLDLEPSWRVMWTFPRPRASLILTPPNAATRFFITMGPSEKVRDATQPDTFDRFVVLATTRNGVNFPDEVLPMLGQREGTPAVLRPQDGDDGRAGYGLDQPGWYVQQLDVRVIETWTCGMTLEDCADGTCYEGICPGHTVYTTDGKCSLAHGMQQCAGKWGDCCNMDGECGTGTDFCGLGKCQLGNCTTSALPPQGTSMPVFSFNFPPGIPGTPTTATAMATGTTSTCRQNIYVIRGLFSLYGARELRECRTT